MAITKTALEYVASLLWLQNRNNEISIDNGVKDIMTRRRNKKKKAQEQNATTANASGNTGNGNTTGKGKGNVQSYSNYKSQNHYLDDWCMHDGRDEVFLFKVEDKPIGFYAGSDFRVGDVQPEGTILLNCTGKARRYSSNLETPEALKALQAFVQRTDVINIDWPDGGSPPLDPEFWRELPSQLVQAGFDKCIAFCMGSHGRTGTALASVAITNLGLTMKDAIELVRDVHCEKAVETMSQLRYLSWVEAWAYSRKIVDKTTPTSQWPEHSYLYRSDRGGYGTAGYKAYGSYGASNSKPATSANKTTTYNKDGSVTTEYGASGKAGASIEAQLREEGFTQDADGTWTKKPSNPTDAFDSAAFDSASAVECSDGPTPGSLVNSDPSVHCEGSRHVYKTLGSVFCKCGEDIDPTVLELRPGDDDWDLLDDGEQEAILEWSEGGSQKVMEALDTAKKANEAWKEQSAQDAMTHDGLLGNRYD